MGKLVDSIKSFGLFDEVNAFTEEDISTEFLKSNGDIFVEDTGFGLWLWKPYIIKDTLDKLNSGDLLLYSDAGCEYIHSPIELIRLLQKEDILSFEISHLQRDWTKKEVFKEVAAETAEEISLAKMRHGAFIGVRKTDFSVNFVTEWLNLCCKKSLLDNKLREKQIPTFNFHRNDQSLYSILCVQHRITAYRDPSQFGNSVRADYPNSTYPQLINHTRSGNLSLVQRFRKSVLPKITKLLRQ